MLDLLSQLPIFLRWDSGFNAELLALLQFIGDYEITLDTLLHLVPFALLGWFGIRLQQRARQEENWQVFKRKIMARSQTLLSIGAPALYEIGRDVFCEPPKVYFRWFKRKPRWSITTIVWQHRAQEISDVVLTFPNVGGKAEAVLATVRSIYDFETSVNPHIDIKGIIRDIYQQADDQQLQKIPVIISPELAMLVCIKGNNKPRRKS